MCKWYIIIGGALYPTPYFSFSDAWNAVREEQKRIGNVPGDVISEEEYKEYISKSHLRRA